MNVVQLAVMLGSSLLAAAGGPAPQGTPVSGFGWIGGNAIAQCAGAAATGSANASGAIQVYTDGRLAFGTANVSGMTTLSGMCNPQRQGTAFGTLTVSGTAALHDKDGNFVGNARVSGSVSLAVNPPGAPINASLWVTGDLVQTR